MSGKSFSPLVVLILLVGCDHKGGEDTHKAVERAPTIVAHLRMDLDRELRDEKGTEVIIEKTEVAPVEKPKEGGAPVTQLPVEEDTRYKTDMEYQALRRYEQPVPEVRKEEKTGEDEKTIAVREKSLVLGGEGFGIQGFGAGMKEDITVDLTRYWEDLRPAATPKEEPAPIDLKEGEIKNKRSFIFHERGSGFFKAEEEVEKPKTKVESEAKSPQPKAVSPRLEKIPETKLYLSQEKGKNLVLLPKEREIDLLMGNEEVNRKAYGNR